jgi:hypothetical protein
MENNATRTAGNARKKSGRKTGCKPSAIDHQKKPGKADKKTIFNCSLNRYFANSYLKAA